MADWAYGLLGGLMIGCAAAMFLLLNGRIMGASGLVGGLIARPSPDWREHATFVAGLALAPLIAAALAGGAETHATGSVPLLVAGGLLVGYGTRLGNGCTSGHGICGLSRGSVRGIAATVTFLGTGMAVMFLLRHVAGVL